MTTHSDVAEVRLRQLQAWVTAAVIGAVVFAMTVLGFMFWQSYRVGVNTQHLKQVALETHGALCAFKIDLTHRYDDGVKYLEDHGSGLTAHGEVLITAAQIKRSLDSQKATLTSLAGLDCS